MLTGSMTVRVIEVGLGRTFDLHCQVTNDPLALDRVRFTWFFNNRRVIARRPKIRIRQRLQSDNGSRVTSSILQVCMCLSGAQEDEGEPATVHINRHMHTHLDCVHIRTYVRTYVADALLGCGASLYSVYIRTYVLVLHVVAVSHHCIRMSILQAGTATRVVVVLYCV